MKHSIFLIVLVHSLFSYEAFANNQGVPEKSEIIKEGPIYGYFTDKANKVAITRHSKDEVTLRAIGGDPYIYEV